MKPTPLVLVTVAFFFGLAIALPARADAVFNFDSDPVGLATTFSETQNGLMATFSSPADPGGFVVNPTFFLTLTGNVLLDPGGAGAFNIPLMISFGTNLSNISMLFATDGPGPFVLNAFENGTFVGSATATGSIPPGFSFPEGSISLGGATFNSVVLTSPDTPFFAIDDVSASPTVPEPASLLLLGSGLLGLRFLRRKLLA